MRRLCITLLCGLVAVPAAMAAARATGDGTLELTNVSGTASITGSRGTLWGQMARGKLIVTDFVAGDGAVLVSGAEYRRPINENVTIYGGSGLHFRVTGGRYKLRLQQGIGINIAAVGVGSAYLIADPLVDDPGDYAIDGGKPVAMPLSGRTVYFGLAPTP
ncbi:MAG: hypothetical protein ACJ76I_09185 [Gaiellaceae bacterium]